MKKQTFHTVDVAIDGKCLKDTSVSKLQDKKLKKTGFKVVVHTEGSDHDRTLVLCRALGSRFWANMTTGSIFTRRAKGVYSCGSRIWAEDARS